MCAACTSSTSVAAIRRWVPACAVPLGAVLVGVMLGRGPGDSGAPAVVGVHPAPGLEGAVATSLDGGGRLSSGRGQRSIVASPETRSRAATGPSGEQAFYRLYAGFQAGTLEQVAREILEGPAPDFQKVALLRALYDLRSAEFPTLFCLAIRSLPDTSSAAAVSVPSFAVRLLAKRARRDPLAREVLEQVAFGGEAVAPSLRRRAAAALAATGSRADLSRLSDHMVRETDSLVVEGALVALQNNPDQAMADAILASFGRSRLVMDKER